MKARNLKAVVILLLLIVFVAQAAGYIIGAQDSSVNTTTGLNQATGYDIGNEISAVWLMGMRHQFRFLCDLKAMEHKRDNLLQIICKL